jgi:hypothetical protein
MSVSMYHSIYGLGRCKDCDGTFSISVDIESEAPLKEVRITAACPGCGAIADMNLPPGEAG